MKTKHIRLNRFPVIALGVLLAGYLPAQTLNFVTTAPTPTNSDVYNLLGSSTDSGNVNDGGSYVDGAGNDGFTYVANNRPSMGQTFTTGPTAGKVTAIWIRQVGYSADTANTFWSFAAGSAETFRITNPSQVGTAGFALDTETYTITGTEPNSPGGFSFSLNGTGLWLRFGLTNSVTLAPNTTYGYDITGIGGDFWETWGTNGNVYSGGAAYIGSTGGVPDNTLNPEQGDRAFLIEFNGGTFTPPPTPTSFATINFQPYGPTPTANDQFNFTGSPDEDGNVNNGVTVGDPNNAGDQFTYAANGQPNQGQFFTTGSNPSGYHVSAVWLEHAGYTSNAGEGNGTFYNFGAGGNPTFTFRLTDPTKVNSTNFAMDTETVTVTGLETNNPAPGAANSANGTGTWIRFGFSANGTNLTLQPNTRYGFDVMGSDGDYFSTLGTSNNQYSAGQAYNGTATAGIPDDVTNLLTGDRVFLVEMVGDNWSLQVAPPLITNQPANTIVPQGASAVFAPVVTGSPTLKYQWYFNTNTMLAGQTNATLTIPAVNTNNGVIGGYSVIVANNYGSVTSRVASLAVLLPAITTNISFSTTAAGSVLDQNGNNTPFYVRLPGTGSAISTDDPNLLYDKVNGVLNVTSTSFDFNGGSGLAGAEAIGMTLAGIGFTGTQDFTVTGYFTNFSASADYDQIGIFAGSSATNFVRGGEIYDDTGPVVEPGSYGVGNLNSNDIGIVTAAAPVGEMAATITRASGVWSVSINGLSVTPNASLTYLNPPLSGANNLIVGVFAENNGLDTPTAQVNAFSASLFTGPKLTIGSSAGNLTLNWNVVGLGLQSNTNLQNNAGWTPVAGATASPYMIPVPKKGTLFYRIAQ